MAPDAWTREEARIARQVLRECEREYARGDKGALLKAIAICAIAGLAMPAWVSANYLRAFDDVKLSRAKTWNDVFGPAHRKGTQLAAARARKALDIIGVWKAVTARHQAGAALDDNTFAEVGAQFKVGKTTAKRLYLSIEKRTRKVANRKR